MIIHLSTAGEFMTTASSQKLALKAILFDNKKVLISLLLVLAALAVLVTMALGPVTLVTRFALIAAGGVIMSVATARLRAKQQKRS
jgi:hypothetical protein